VDRVTQSIYFPSNEEKLPLLLTLLRDHDASRTMVFVNTRRECERLRDRLQANGINAEALSGDVPQRKRLRMLKDFQSGELAVLIGTDVASRGLHVPGVSHVFNYDLPQDPEDYVHRIGRTARAGAAGDAISFGCEAYAISLPDIEDFIGRKIPVANFDRSTLVSELPHTPSHRPHRHGPGPGPGGQRRGSPRRRRPPNQRRS
jgi:ATP-dependent RNA helicase RhlB